MYEVIYFSRSGNTRKLAAAIADELNVKARHIQAVQSIYPDSEIFLGSGLYFMRPAKLIREFIRNTSLQRRKIVIFGTSTAGIGIETMWMDWLLKRKGAIITGKYYCPGRFFLRIAGKHLFIRKGRPSDKDLEKARKFTRLVTNNFSVKIEIKIEEENNEDRILSCV